MQSKDYNLLLQSLASPLDYSVGLYLVYVEVPVPSSSIKKIISKHAKIISSLEFGYICEMPMQAIPEVVRSLSSKNHAIYQIIRLFRLSQKN